MKDMGIVIKDTKKYSIFNHVPPTIEECLNKLSDSTDVFKAFGPLKLEEHNYTKDEAAPSLTSPYKAYVPNEEENSDNENNPRLCTCKGKILLLEFEA